MTESALPGAWSAQWIEPVEAERAPAGSRPTTLLRTSFEAPATVAAARLFITAHGIYEAHLDGVRIGDAELTPGYTEYSRRLQVQSYDVTALLSPGRPGTLAVELSDGWYRGQVGLLRLSDQWGESTALLAQLEITDAAGAVTTVGTDASWRARPSEHLADLIAGETIDLRADLGWKSAADDSAAWAPVALADHGYDRLVVSAAPPVRRVQELVPVAVTRHGDAQIVDLGQNINGWLRIRDLGPAGSRITLTHGEALGPDGDVTQMNIEPDVPFMDGPLPAGQIDHVVSNGDPTAVFEPRHSTKGFRYVRVEGLARELAPAEVTGIVVHTDMERTGWFECSNDDLNRLHEAALWSFRGNACDVPTDCPTRERAAWADGWAEFFDSAAYLYDVADFSTKWLRDLVVGQWENGVVANQAPMPRGEGQHSPIGFMNGSASWGDAAVLVPWAQYLAYDDPAILGELWPTMVRWLDFVQGVAEGARHDSRIAARPEPALHERYLWDSGFHFGEWLAPQPDGDFDFGELMAADKGDIATAYYFRSASLMARIAEILGISDAAARYAGLAGNIRAAWQTEFFDRHGRIEPATQANCVRALAWDLVEERHRPAVTAQLVALLAAADNHVGTGFQATPILLQTLTDAGHPELAYEVLLQRTWPSWLGMLDQGATTLWERWEGYKEGVPFESHNHFSKGGIISFLHRQVAGIRPIDGIVAYERFTIQPVPGGGLEWAKGRLRTPRGLIESSWRIAEGRFTLEVTVPEGTRCEVVMPDGARHEVAPGEHRFEAALAG